MSAQYLGNEDVFSWAIMSLFAWLLPHISLQIGEYHRAVRKSPVWSSDPDTKALGMSAVKHAAIVANVFALACIVGAATAVALLTKNLDLRMLSIVTGLSRLVGAVVLFALSWHFPEWLEVYHLRRRREVLPVSGSVRALRFNVFCSVAWHHTTVFFLLLPFYCGKGPVAIPVSAAVGLFIGAGIDVCVYLGKRRVRDGDRRGARRLVYVMLFCGLFLSSALFAAGAIYINEVWGQKDAGRGVWLGCFFIWFVAAALIHVFLWKRTRNVVNEKYRARSVAKSMKYKNAIGGKIVEKVDESKDVAVTAAKNVAAVFGSNSGGNAATEHAGGGDADDGEETERRQTKVAFADPPQEDDADVTGDQTQGEVEVSFADSPQDKDATASGDASKSFDENDNKDAAASDDSSESFDEEMPRNSNTTDGVAVDPSYCFLVKSKLCGGGDGERSCCCSCCAGRENWKTKALFWCWYLLWVVLCLFAVYFVLINIGATHQQNVTKAKLPGVRAILYDNMNDIEVCAYDGDGTAGSLNETSVIETFPSKAAARDSDFLVLHCGPCAACSTWPNIKYEYTTRSFLADAGKTCGIKSIFGGYDAVLTCLKGPPINWDDACGRCWTTDILCAKKYCVFNFLQSTMINTITDFSVGIDKVTAATCEEANCEAFPYPENFVECSGATRRRMNVTSSIRRPPREQCNNVDIKWETLFPGE